ncbi:MAG TPA: ABC transporter permease [Vicinamibacteria bacterium]|nr:ABC transporter permease [Vicinamibacteria bacterium]
MRRYIARRFAQMIPMMLIVGSLGFALVQLAPGDPVTALGGEFAHQEVQRELRERYGLDRSLLEQYVVYLGRLFQGELGESYYFQRPVAMVLWERLPATLLLVVPSLATSTFLGVVLGLRIARKVKPARARGLIAAIAASNAVPVFWLAQLLLLVFAVRLGWFPVQGMTDPRSDGSATDLVEHLLLPLLTLTLHQLAFITVLTWTGVERELSTNYVLAAESRGLRPNVVLVSHALRNTLPPLVTTVGGRVAAIFSGAVLTETVFAWPGLGRLSVLASTNRDYPLVLGIFLLITATVVLANLITDILYAVVDPRVRYS